MKNVPDAGDRRNQVADKTEQNKINTVDELVPFQRAFLKSKNTSCRAKASFVKIIDVLLK